MPPRRSGTLLRLRRSRPVPRSYIEHSAQAMARHLAHKQASPRSTHASSIIATSLSLRASTKVAPVPAGGGIDRKVQELVYIKRRLTILPNDERSHLRITRQHRRHSILTAGIKCLHIWSRIKTSRM